MLIFFYSPIVQQLQLWIFHRKGHYLNLTGKMTSVEPRG